MLHFDSAYEIHAIFFLFYKVIGKQYLWLFQYWYIRYIEVYGQASLYIIKQKIYGLIAHTCIYNPYFVKERSNFFSLWKSYKFIIHFSILHL